MVEGGLEGMESASSNDSAPCQVSATSAAAVAMNMPTLSPAYENQLNISPQLKTMKAGQARNVNRLEGLLGINREHLMTDRNQVSPGLTDSLRISPELRVHNGTFARHTHAVH